MPIIKARRFHFADQLKQSQDYQAYLEKILRSRFNKELVVQQASEKCDRAGTDYWAWIGERERPLSIDLKVRYEDFKTKGADDLALETWSVCHSKVGWTRDPTKETDYVIWFWVDTGRYFIVPFPVLCRIFKAFWEIWSKQYRTAIQDSGRWKSECVFVPRSVLENAMKMWGSGKIKD